MTRDAVRPLTTAGLLKLMLLAGQGSSDNYAYLVVDEKSRDAVIIDPANPPEWGGSFWPTSRISMLTDSAVSHRC